MYQLPKIYEKKHDFCIHVYDQILELFKSIDECGALKVNIDIKESEAQKIFINLKGEELYTWLLQNGYNKEIAEMNYKECFAAILSDMLQFILTAFHCSEKGQLTVTYTLLRKPLKDNLFYLEFLLADPVDFLRRFNSSKNVSDLAVEQCQKDEKISIIDKAIEIINLPLYDGLTLYDLRYNKRNDIGFEPAFQQANHLITKYDYYRTSEGNFNFVFSNSDDKESQWQFLYITMPQLMVYILHIVTELSKNIIKLPDYWSLILLKHVLGLSYVMSGSFSVVKNSFKEIFDDVNWKCDVCGTQLVFDYQQFRYFQAKFGLICKKCKKEYSFMS
ncbi:MAG: hypothetical protein HGA99_10050 [Chlorobiaceae bacterium]|nr:hypothetical protein [Chlorobiaceae bacterium]